MSFSRGWEWKKPVLQAHERPGEANDRVLFIAPGATVTIRDITIRHGNPTSEPKSGGGVRNEGALTLENVIVRANSASAGGGILNDGTLTLINCTVRDNGSHGGGSSYTECKTGGGLKNLTGEMTLITLPSKIITQGPKAAAFMWPVMAPSY